MDKSKAKYLRTRSEQRSARPSDRPSAQIRAEWQAAIERIMNNFRGRAS